MTTPNKWTCSNCLGPKADTEALCTECRLAPKEMPEPAANNADDLGENTWDREPFEGN